MMGLIIRGLYLLFLVYVAMAAVISIRDLVITRGSRLWIPLVAIGFGAFVLAFLTNLMPVLIVPIFAFISLPIFITDKRRNFDALDRVFRWVSLIAVLGAIFVSVNYFYLR